MNQNILGEFAMTTPLPKICLISGADEIRTRAYINHYIYAREHGLDYRLECGLDDDIRTKYDYKTSIMRRILPYYDWVVWIDDDAYFTDFEADDINDHIKQAENENKFLVIADGPLEPNGFWSKINTGVLALKNCEESFKLLTDFHNLPLDEVRAWWDDERDGLFTNGDQDQLWMALNTTGLLDKTLIVDSQRFNSRGHYYKNSLQDAAVMHFCGYPDKEIGVVRFAKQFNIGQELVPEHLLDKYAAVVRSPIKPLEFEVRNRKMIITSRIKHDLRPYYHKFKAWKDSKQKYLSS